MTAGPARLGAALADRYRLERELGAGGMATVYLAHDLKHARDVALKVLRPELAAVIGAERFLAEIKTTANLQHPHILPLFDSGTVEGTVFYVMPFVEGESLRDRLTREKQLSIDEAVRITREVASALDYAHRHGVIHRDIKPENILLHDGQALVADFGIALAASSAGGSRMTETGMSLGTPHYMSPEQATAEKEISGRSDIYSLGSVLFEMLTGAPPHVGGSAQQIIMKIVTEEAQPVTLMRKAVPANVAAAVAKSLEKLPADRFASAREFADALGNPLFVGASASNHAGTTAGRNRRGVPGWLPWAVAVVALVAVGAGWFRPSATADVSRFAVVLPDSQAINAGLGSGYRLAVSPDGRTIAYVGYGPGQRGRRLWVRHLHELRATPLPGTEGALNPAFSPDGQQLAFVAGARPILKWVSVRGGPVTEVTDSLVDDGGVAWGRDGYLYYAGPRGILRVPATERGRSELVAATTLAGPGEAFQDPAPLPNGRGVLFTRRTADRLDVLVIDETSSTPRVLVRGTLGRYAKSRHLLYVTDRGIMMAAPFDADRLVLTGEAVALGEQVGLRVRGRGDLGISEDGLLAYTSHASQPLLELVWVARDGRTAAVDSTWVEPFLGRATLSSDGQLMAAPVADPGGMLPTLWVKRVDRGAPSPLGPINATPAWVPRTRTILYVTGAGGLALGPADGSVPPTAVGGPIPGGSNPEFSPDGRWIVYHAQGDIFAMQATGDSAPQTIVAGPASETLPTISPDGRWLAFASDESGRPEIYVRPFPDTKAGREKMSVAGGARPRWSRDGRELFFIDARNDLVALPIGRGSPLSAGPPQRLFSAAEFSEIAFDVDVDGRRFLLSRPVGGRAERPDDLILVQGFLGELKARVGR